MKAYLTEITLGYSDPGVMDQETLEKFRKYSSEARFKNLLDFTGYGIKEGTPEYTAKLEKYNEYMKSDKRELYHSGRAFLVDLKLFMNDFPQLKFNVLGTREVEMETPSQEVFINSILEDNKRAIDTMVSTFEKMSRRIAEHHAPDTFNQHCEVHMGGGLLMTVNEITLLEDSCSDVLQSSLDSGWRILSVCVQPDGRRPDYVLGRYDPDRSVSSRANRR